MPRRIQWYPSFVAAVLLGLCLLPASPGLAAGEPKEKPPAMIFVVMDPLAKEMACACVKGYGQRDYRKLVARLEAALKQPIAIEFSDDLTESLKFAGPGRQVIVVGDRSLVLHGASAAGLACQPVAALTDREGNTTQTASFIVRGDDPAKELKDIAGRTILFGLPDADKKLEAATASLRGAGVTLPTKLEKRPAYSDAALDMLDSTATPPPVAVIPSFAPPLLEGCGSIKPGSFRVIGQSKPAPFITVFVSDNLTTAVREKVLKALLEIKADAKLLQMMESRDGFKPLDPKETGKPPSSAARDWPDWRGPNRDGHVPRLPERLPTSAKFVWKKAAVTGGLAGLSVSEGRLIVAERDFGDERDVYRCLNADTGELLWLAQFPAAGQLDYGQAPRATPVVRDGRVYLLGAFGELRCVNLADGKPLWKRHLPQEFKAQLPTWGMCSTPLLVDDLLIVNPGATDASLVALDSFTGRTRWATSGIGAAYSSFICGTFGGQRQIVGYDEHSLGGWDVATGQRLWRLVPPAEGDFNVPTPLALAEGLVVSTENNGTRLYRFDESGRIIPKPAGERANLSPDTTSPVAVGGRVFGVHLGLHCLDARKGLQPVWHHADDTVGDYASLITDEERVLVTTVRGELILLDAQAETCKIISRLRILEDDAEVYSHPALVGTRFFVRGGSTVMCLDLAVNQQVRLP
jgi:outer membrane protein assembly factor BamB